VIDRFVESAREDDADIQAQSARMDDLNEKLMKSEHELKIKSKMIVKLQHILEDTESAHRREVDVLRQKLTDSKIARLRSNRFSDESEMDGFCWRCQNDTRCKQSKTTQANFKSSDEETVELSNHRPEDRITPPMSPTAFRAGRPGTNDLQLAIQKHHIRNQKPKPKNSLKKSFFLSFFDKL